MTTRIVTDTYETARWLKAAINLAIEHYEDRAAWTEAHQPNNIISADSLKEVANAYRELFQSIKYERKE